MLKANFKITENGGSGVVQLQASEDGLSWISIGLPMTLSSGHLTVDDSANVQIDTDIFTPGQTYQFRLADVAGSPVSNTKTFTIHAITAVTAGLGIIDVTDHGGGDFTFGLHASPAPVQVPAGATMTGYDYEVNFWHLLTVTPIDSAADMTADQSLSASGNMDGIYVAQVKYKYSDGTAFTISRVTKVDNTGAIVLDIQINGCTIADISGLQLTDQAHIIQTGCNYHIIYAALQPDDSVTQLTASVAPDTPQVLTIPADTRLILYVINWDDAISDHFDHDFFPFHYVTIA